MKIGILSRASHSYSTRRLVEAAKSARHQVIVLDPFRFSLHIDLPTCYQRQLRFRPDQAKQPKSAGVGRTSERHNIDCLHILYDGKPIFDENLECYVEQLNDATDLIWKKDGGLLQYSLMPDSLFLEIRDIINNGNLFDILDL